MENQAPNAQTPDERPAAEPVQAAPASNQPSQGKLVPVVLGILILLVVVLAAFYIYGMSLTRSATMPKQAQRQEAIVQKSTDLGSIEKDLAKVDVETSDRELKEVDDSF